jgi:hypothetical protein
LLSNDLTAGSIIAIHMHPSKCSSVRRVLVLDLTFFIKLNSCPLSNVRPNIGDINKTCFSDIRKLFFLIQGDTYYRKYTGTRAAQNIGELPAVRGFRTSVTIMPSLTMTLSGLNARLLPSITLLLPTVAHYKVRGWTSHQWHNIHTKFHENSSSHSLDMKCVLGSEQ